MSDYLLCISTPENPGQIKILTSRSDPRVETPEMTLWRRQIGPHTLEWSLPVVDRHLSEAALRKALRPHRDRADKACFSCNPMEARGAAISLTTLRPDARVRKKPSLLRRLIRAA